MVWSVPIVVLFTKFDTVVPLALEKLAPTDRRLPKRERLLKTKSLIEADVWARLFKMTYLPKSSVRLEGLYYVFLYMYYSAIHQYYARHAWL
jgi:hypothetical protein